MVEFVNNGTSDSCANKLLDKKAIKKHTLRNSIINTILTNKCVFSEILKGKFNL